MMEECLVLVHRIEFEKIESVKRFTQLFDVVPNKERYLIYSEYLRNPSSESQIENAPVKKYTINSSG